LRRLSLELAAALLLAAAPASPAAAQAVRAAGGVEVIEALDRSHPCAVGVTRKLGAVDAKAYTAELVVEQALGAGVATGRTLRIVWEELAAARPPRFGEGERVLVCLTPLPGSTLWLRRFPDPEERRELLAVAGRGSAFVRTPLPGSVSQLEHYARLTPADRAGAAGAARLAALAARAELPLAEEAVARLAARQKLAEQIDAASARALIEALLRSDANAALPQAVLRLIGERRPPALRPPLVALTTSAAPAPALVYEALARFDGGLAPERSAALLRDASPARRATAARYASGPDAASRLNERLRTDPDAGVRAAAVERLVALEQERALSAAMATLADEDPDVRLAGARAVASLGAAAVPDLRDAVVAARQPAASTAVVALRMTGTDAAHAALVAIAQTHPDEAIRKLAGLAIGEPLGESHDH
jgi:HEAT repeat protein